jgi:hypothetical protein
MPSVNGVDDDVPPQGYGVRGASFDGYGVFGDSFSSSGVVGRCHTSRPAVYGESHSGYGVYGYSYYRHGVHGYSPTGYGVSGYSDFYHGVHGSTNTAGVGVFGSSNYGTGVVGISNYGDGMHGESHTFTGVYGTSDTGVGLHGHSTSGYAAFLEGNVRITGTLQKGGGSFKIDHPVDPANKYLSHSFVESPDMKNIYDGIVALDNNGEAVIELPDWFGALNKDFRYQLTAIGAPGPNLYIAEEISDGVTNDSNDSNSSHNNNSNNRFKIAGGTPGMKVSWNVTGIRKDPWANAHRIQVEEAKPDKERGYYIYPELYGQPAENEISRLLFPEEEQKLLINENKRPKRKIPS